MSKPLTMVELDEAGKGRELYGVTEREEDVSALKRVEAWLHGLDHDRRVVAVGLPPMGLADLRSVLALAEQAGELKRRLKLVRADMLRRGVLARSDSEPLLDLRKPLPKEGRR